MSINILNLYQVDHAIFLYCPQLVESHFTMYDVYLPKGTLMYIVFLVYSWI